MPSTKYKIGDRVKLQPPYGPHIGKEATIVRIPDVVGSEAWYIVKLDDGTELLGPESQIEYKGEESIGFDK